MAMQGGRVKEVKLSEGILLQLGEAGENWLIFSSPSGATTAINLNAEMQDAPDAMMKGMVEVVNLHRQDRGLEPVRFQSGEDPGGLQSWTGCEGGPAKARRHRHLRSV